MRHARTWIGTLVILLLLSACAAQTASSTQTVEGLSITLTQPVRPMLNADQELIVELRNEAGQPVDGAVVTLDLTMPAMPMGTNQPIAEPLGNGRYRARTVATMDGDWEIEVSALIGGRERTATFTQVVAP